MTPPRSRMLPGSLLETSSGKRSTRDWIVDVTMYALAILIGGLALGSTTERHSEEMVFFDLVIGVGTLIALWWRRRYPFAVALITIVPGAPWIVNLSMSPIWSIASVVTVSPAASVALTLSGPGSISASLKLYGPR